jgi:hypothetical protein
MKKRILVLLTVVALMVVMLAMSVAPAFATNTYTCTIGTRVISNLDHKFAKGIERSGGTCVKDPKT